MADTLKLQVHRGNSAILIPGSYLNTYCLPPIILHSSFLSQKTDKRTWIKRQSHSELYYTDERCTAMVKRWWEQAMLQITTTSSPSPWPCYLGAGHPVHTRLQWRQCIVSSTSVSTATSCSADGSLTGFIIQQHSDTKLCHLYHTCFPGRHQKNTLVAFHTKPKRGFAVPQPSLMLALAPNSNSSLTCSAYNTQICALG